MLKRLENLDKTDELLPSARVRNSALTDTASENADGEVEKLEKDDSWGIQGLRKGMEKPLQYKRLSEKETRQVSILPLTEHDCVD